MSTLDKPVNPNYCATVVRVAKVFDLKGCDNIVGASVFGFQVLIGRDAPDIGVFFPAETQLSDMFCYENNLYRHGDKNKDKGKTGFIEDNRRVRAIKLRGNVSNGLFMPLDSLDWTGMNTGYLTEGQEFDRINDAEICRKYELPKKKFSGQTKARREFERADKLFMPEHLDTENFFKNADKIDPEAEVIVTQKLHGTSVRIGHTLVNRKLSLLERVARLLGAKIAETEHAELYGSKKVIKDANNPNQKHYYDSDIWTIVGKRLDGVLPENYIVYGEIVGWTPEGKEIQKNYTYGLPVGQCELYVYRIAVVNSRGHMTDLSWEQVKEFCNKNNLKHVPQLFKCKMRNLTLEDFRATKDLLDIRFSELNWPNQLEIVSLGENKEIVDEGICVRADGLLPKILKAKSPKFFEHETAILDSGEEDIETTQTNE